MATNIDAPPVADEQEALSLMFHHLYLAAAYFEAAPSNIDKCKPQTFSAPAIWAWLDAMDKLYPDEAE